VYAIASGALTSGVGYAIWYAALRGLTATGAATVQLSVPVIAAIGGVMLLGEEFGVHMPRALVSFIASLGPVGAAMEAAFPFLAIIVGATLLLEHLSKLREAGVKLEESQVQFGTTTANVLNGLNDKLLQAGIKADELNNNHLAALNKQLVLIDHVSMNELVQAFGTISKAADELFKQMEKHWYQFGSGSAGAKASLDRFKNEYDALLAKKDTAGANKLLDETISREEKILALQKQQASSVMESWKGGQKGDYKEEVEATTALKAMGAKWDKDAVAAQEVMVKTLHDQFEAQKAITELSKGEKGNAKTETLARYLPAEQPLAMQLLGADPDILAEVAARGTGAFIVGFAAETNDVAANARAKLEAKGIDLLVANDVSRRDIGFDAEENEVLLIDRWGSSRALPRMPKSAVADAILDEIVALRAAHPARKAVR